MDTEATAERKTPDDRKQALARAIQTEVAGGSRIESQGDYQAVAVRGHRVNHVLHLILSLVTLGAWLIVWLALVLFAGEKRRLMSVDEYGNLTVQKV